MAAVLFVVYCLVPVCRVIVCSDMTLVRTYAISMTMQESWLFNISLLGTNGETIGHTAHTL